MESGEVPMIGTPGLLQGNGKLQRGLAAELDDHPVRLLDLHDVEHVLVGQRLEIEPVGGVVVGGDGLRVAVDHDRLVAVLGQGEDAVHAAVVELDPLADPVRPAAEDHDLFPAGDLRLALILVGGVEIGGVGDELGRAGIDPLEDRPDPEGEAQLPHLLLALPPEAAEELVGEAILLRLADDVLQVFLRLDLQP